MAAPSWVSPCIFMLVPAARLSFKRPSELARSLAVESTPLESEKVSEAPKMLDDTDTTAGAAEAVLITIDSASVQTWAALSLACTVKLAVCAVVGEPEMMPLLLLMVSPAGSVPEVTDQV